MWRVGSFAKEDFVIYLMLKVAELTACSLNPLWGCKTPRLFLSSAFENSHVNLILRMISVLMRSGECYCCG